MREIFSRYGKYLDLPFQPFFHGMCEGSTPLFRSRSIFSELGENVDLFFKLESRNPSLSFKDRGVSLASAIAFQEKKAGLVCVSSGNLGVSCALFSARTGMKCLILVPKLFADEEKIRAMEMFGANVFILDASPGECFPVAGEYSGRNNMEFIWHGNARYLAGLKTMAFEVCDELGRAPDVFSCGVGHGSLVSACWYGFKQYFAEGRIKKLPVMMGFMSEEAFSGGKSRKAAAGTGYSGEIGIGLEGICEGASIARDESSGYIAPIGDCQAQAVFEKLARREALPAAVQSCVCVAGLYKLKSDGVDFDNQTIVSVLDGAADASAMPGESGAPARHLKVIKPTVEDLESEMVIQ